MDELKVTIRPVLLGVGRRLFEHLDVERGELEQIGVADPATPTDLRFRVEQHGAWAGSG